VTGFRDGEQVVSRALPESVRDGDTVRLISNPRRTRPRTTSRSSSAPAGKEEIRRVHVERAKLLLAQTDLKVQSVALQAGFRRYAFFVRRFRACVGMTPTAFRAQYGARGGASWPAAHAHGRYPVAPARAGIGVGGRGSVP